MSRRQPFTERSPRSVETGIGQDCFDSAVVFAADTALPFLSRLRSLQYSASYPCCVDVTKEVPIYTARGQRPHVRLLPAVISSFLLVLGTARARGSTFQVLSRR